MHQLGKRVRDKRVLALVGKYLRAGVRHEDGSTEKTLKGVPQGGPLSPLLANVMLDPLDKKIEALQLPFARYADDFLILARTKAEAIHAMAEVKDYVEGKLKLLVNQNKSQVAPLRECSFLGFHIQGKKIRRTDKAVRRFNPDVAKIAEVRLARRTQNRRRDSTGVRERAGCRANAAMAGLCDLAFWQIPFIMRF
jgi:RNA-directed DNA polymerase